jgi:hypothetical protein
MVVLSFFRSDDQDFVQKNKAEMRIELVSDKNSTIKKVEQV